ncbi:MAG: carboxymuconolactone decarboxylase family protein [Acidimicrobiales bacterium]|jgi:AhpD family alkylhydroperoxidase
MPHVDPLARTDLPDFEEGFALTEAFMGFVPNSMLTMARVPGLMPAFQQLAGAVFRNGLISPDLTQMIAYVASHAAGCRYCQAHTGHSAERLGVDQTKLAELWSFETSELFSEAERAALRIGVAGGSVPNSASQELFDAAREFWSDDQLAAIVSVVALFGYLNRWNDTMGTELETSPTAFGERVLADNGWEVGRHA